MRKNIFRLFSIFIILLTIIACKNEIREKNELVDLLTEIKLNFAPDKRVALFDINAIKSTKGYILTGETNLPEAIITLNEKLKEKNITFTDSIKLLPSKNLNGKTVGLVTISVANLRSNPKHSAELATQALLGTPVNIYKKDGSWSLIQTPDKYLAWVDSGGVEPMTLAELATWKSSNKIIYTAIYGSTYSNPDITSQVVSDVVAGDILELLDEDDEFYKVKYPDTREAYINKKDAELYSDWLLKTNATQETLVATSKKLMGLPYLWGGTSTKGVDCSGFTKTVYFLNGMVIPRDASQQVHTGEQIDDTKDFDKLVPGDLLFFGRQATDSSTEKVIHVGMWIGNNEFIHSSGQVKISSVDKEAPNFDEYNLNRYLRSKRLLKSNNGDLLNLTKTPIFNISAFNY
tara:strand:+ start:2291 stop:3502 length:1212 start_codon:yes stop_codon:yes gene_type:complete